MNAQPNAKVASMSTETWLLKSSKMSVPVKSKAPIPYGQRTTDQVPSTGLGHRIVLNVHLKIVIADTTITAGTWKGWPDPAPHSFVERVKLGNNRSTDLLDLSGWNLYRRTVARTGVDTARTNTSSWSTQASDALRKDTFPAPGTAVAAGTYEFNCTYDIPMSYNDAGDQGLLVLASNSNLYNLEIDWSDPKAGMSATGGSNDFFAGLVGTGITYTVEAWYSWGLEFFTPPDDLSSIAQMRSLYMTCFDRQDSTIHNGVNRIKMTTDDYFTLVSGELINNGAPVNLYSYVSSIQWRHSGTVVDLDYDPFMLAADNLYKHNAYPLDGEFTFDWGMRRGVIQRRDAVDAFDSTVVTQPEIGFTVDSGLSLTNPSLNLYIESLRPFNK